MKKILFILVLFLVLIGCDQTKNNWIKAKQTNSVAEVKKFLEENSGSEFDVAAKNLLDSLESCKVKLTDNANEVSAFIKNYPDSKYINDVKAMYQLVNIPFKLECEFGEVSLHGASSVGSGAYSSIESYFDPPATLTGSIKSLKINGIVIELIGFQITESIIKTKDFGDIKYVCQGISQTGKFQFVSLANQIQINKIKKQLKI